jgi:hypothetical protein
MPKRTRKKSEPLDIRQLARAKKLSAEQRKAIAEKAAGAQRQSK